MKQSNGVVQIVGLEGMSTTERAREVVEEAGYCVVVQTLAPGDLAYMKAELGASRLPAARMGAETFEGMDRIRARFIAPGPRR